MSDDEHNNKEDRRVSPEDGDSAAMPDSSNLETITDELGGQIIEMQVEEQFVKKNTPLYSFISKSETLVRFTDNQNNVTPFWGSET